MVQKITLIQGHPDGEEPHYCHALADAYRAGAVDTGHAVKVLDIGQHDIKVLRSRKQWLRPEREPFIEESRAAVHWADHVVLIYPLWMGTMPAHLKTFIEQVFSEEFAFSIDENGWHSKLKGRTARVIVTMGMPSTVYRYFFFAHSLKSLRRNILGFAGFSPIRDTVIGMIDAENPKNRLKWLGRMNELGAEAR